MNIPTAHSIDSLERFIEHIQNAPVPRRVTISYLKRTGFRTGNDPELRHIFRLLGFLSDNDVPLKRWRLYKANGRAVLKTAVEECYKNLFDRFPDAAVRSDDELALWFRPPMTSDSKTSVIRAIRTFRKLCSIARISSGNKLDVAGGTVAESAVLKTSEKPALVFQLPSYKDKSEYKQIFEAFKEVFYS